MGSTINDIAREAGVSIATVSRVINGSAQVTEDTKQKVKKVMDKLNYSPSIIARGLKLKSMKNIALFVSSFLNVHHMRIAHEINSHFSKLDYDVVMYETGNSAEGLARAMKRIIEKGMDGAIFIGSSFQVLLEKSEETKKLISSIPITIANGWVEGTYGIFVDEYKGMKDAVKHLVSINRRRLLYLKGTDSISSDNKLAGFIDGCKEEGLEEFTHIRSENDVVTTRRLFDERNLASKYDGIICDEDNYALVVIKTLKRLGVRVPEDVAVIGCNNSDFSSLSSPGITTVNNKPEEQGIECAIILDEILSKGSRLEKKILITIEPELVIRESTLLS